MCSTIRCYWNCNFSSEKLRLWPRVVYRMRIEHGPFGLHVNSFIFYSQPQNTIYIHIFVVQKNLREHFSEGTVHARLFCFFSQCVLAPILYKPLWNSGTLDTMRKSRKFSVNILWLGSVAIEMFNYQKKMGMAICPICQQILQ